METQEPPESNWRELMARDDRIEVCQYVIAKLTARYHPAVPIQPLREITSAFESQTYVRGESRRDYLQRIAVGLNNVDRQFVQQKENAALAQQRAAGSTATTASNPEQQIHAAAPVCQKPAQQSSVVRILSVKRTGEQPPSSSVLEHPTKESSSHVRISSSKVTLTLPVSRCNAENQSIEDNTITGMKILSEPFESIASSEEELRALNRIWGTLNE